MPHSSLPALHVRRGYWLVAGVLLLVILSGLWNLQVQRQRAAAQASQRQLESQAWQFTTAMQSSAQSYARFLLNLQASLQPDAQADNQSLIEQWFDAIQTPEFAGAHIVRMLSPDASSTQGGEILARLAQPRKTAVVEAVFNHDSGLTLVALPASTPQPKPSSRNHRPPATQGPLIAMNLDFDDWVRELQRMAPIPGLQVTARPAAEAIHAATPPALSHAGGHLQMVLPLLGQAVVLDFRPQAMAWPGDAGAELRESLAPIGPQLLAALGLLLLLGLLIHERRYEWLQLGKMQHYRMHAYQGWLRYRAFINQPLLPMAETEPGAGRFMHSTQRFSQLLGYSQEALRALTLKDVIHTDDLPAVLHTPPGSPDGTQFNLLRTQNVRLLHSLGHYVWVDLLRIENWPSNAGDSQAYEPGELLIAVDLSPAKKLEAELKRRIEKNQLVFQQLPVGLCILDNQWRISFMNPQFVAFSKLGPQGLGSFDEWWEKAICNPRYRDNMHRRWHELSASALTSNGLIAPMEISLQSEPGTLVRTVELAGIMLDDQVVLTLVDLTPHKQAEEEIRMLAFYDGLTGLPNRRLLLDRLQQALLTSSQHQWHGALLLLDLDKFKTLNEAHGHSSGDAILREVANRLHALIPRDQTTARTGADEFIILLSALASTEDEAVRLCKDLGHRIIASLQEPQVIDGHTLHIDACIGITVFHSLQVGSEELMRRADMALHQAKQTGPGKLRFFDPAMQANASARAALEEDIRAGMALDQFMLFFQPQVCDGRITGAEVLLRWRHGDDGFVSPDQFISTAEQSNLILPLGNWVLHQACKQLAIWAQHEDTATLSLSVNVSPRQFKQDNFVQQVLTALASTGAPAQRLKLELTESVLLENVDQAIMRMSQLKEYGVGFSLDDFGTGYSSLSYLQRLPLCQLKIDRSFVRDLSSNPNDASIVRTIVGLGLSLGLEVVAEGVETALQVDYLRQCGCHIWQGYFIGKPQPLGEFEQMLRNKHRAM
ncbi:EAL domain-containing protein [Corticibacter populi]|uniref:EAL domain-containing protein n=1 Tax=Corticibacter populi TaxID=1550736 RepID=A0A3M6R0E7_9BURK|nr:EAL domain-containing protein [Corticibacter populi]RMX08720.1 EAL domain-containing protein [Corticibacter populi]RZS36069.1 diguanylate cyclase (GGDEF)-like protein [Corticibacter populi]